MHKIINLLKLIPNKFHMLIWNNERIFYSVLIIIILVYLSACNKQVDPTTTIVNQMIKEKVKEKVKDND